MLEIELRNEKSSYNKFYHTKINTISYKNKYNFKYFYFLSLSI